MHKRFQAKFMIVKKFISVLLCSFKVPEHLEITESLAEKLHRLAQLNVRMGRLRERVQFTRTSPNLQGLVDTLKLIRQNTDFMLRKWIYYKG